jgi:hypothetical protein
MFTTWTSAAARRQEPSLGRSAGRRWYRPSGLYKNRNRKTFFFEKKNQKTFAYLHPAFSPSRPEFSEVFWFLLSKKLLA